MEFVRELLRLITKLNEHGVDYVLVGGAALNVHGLIRATEDCDLFIKPTSNNVERLKTALKEVWADPSIDEITAEDLCGDYPAVRYGPPNGTLYLDILTRLGELTSYEDMEWEEVRLGEVPVRVATPKMLFRMKKDTVRPRDQADALALQRYFDVQDDPG